MTTYEEAQEVGKTLWERFNGAAEKLPVTGYGLIAGDNGFYVRFGLSRPLTQEEAANAPVQRDNVPVKYVVMTPPKA